MKPNETPSTSDCRVIWNERAKWLLNLNTKSVAEIEKEHDEANIGKFVRRNRRD
jgi:hypothetical protein